MAYDLFKAPTLPTFDPACSIARRQENLDRFDPATTICREVGVWPEGIDNER